MIGASYQPIEDYGLIGDMHTVALVGKEGSIDFMSFPSFDSPTIFAALLDRRRGGRFSIAPDLSGSAQKQLHVPDTNVLITRWLSAAGVAEVSDFMPGRSGSPRSSAGRPGRPRTARWCPCSATPPGAGTRSSIGRCTCRDGGPTTRSAARRPGCPPRAGWPPNRARGSTSDRALGARVPFRYFTADAGYGRDPALRAVPHRRGGLRDGRLESAAGRARRWRYPPGPGARHGAQSGVGAPLVRQRHQGRPLLRLGRRSTDLPATGLAAGGRATGGWFPMFTS
jgi:hypothetical protein